ncbi:patatin-like phospholipase family protein [Novosphingobium sp. RD2P27]|uniref:Patatin-like phospholipase family protein n=1 Tax=Novosphingobium kalidii TaxID=3230299 RepID=A0ABV2CWE9_9SPHN
MQSTVIGGNAPERRVAALQELWRIDGRGRSAADTWQPLDEARRTQAVSSAMTIGEPGWFAPRSLYGPLWNPFGNPEPSSLYDSSPLEGRLRRLVDFDLLNHGTTRFSATAVDIETGAEIVYDNRSHRFTAHHLRAIGALMPVFSPVELEGRLVGDAGLSTNLPLDVVMGARADRSVLCIAFDLLPLRSGRPESLGAVASRTQDLIFATQSRRAIAAWQAIFAERAGREAKESITLLHISYADQDREVSGKAFDFSRASASARWQAGHKDAERALAAIAAKSLPLGEPGLHAYALGSGEGDSPRLQPIDAKLGPVLA